MDARERVGGIHPDIRSRADAVGRCARARHDDQSKSNALRRLRRGQRLVRFVLRRRRLRLERPRQYLDAARREPVFACIDCVARNRCHADASDNLRGGDLRIERESRRRVVGGRRLQPKRPMALARWRRVVDFVSRGNLRRLPVLHQRSMSGRVGRNRSRVADVRTGFDSRRRRVPLDEFRLQLDAGRAAQPERRRRPRERRRGQRQGLCDRRRGRRHRVRGILPVRQRRH